MGLSSSTYQSDSPFDPRASSGRAGDHFPSPIRLPRRAGRGPEISRAKTVTVGPLTDLNIWRVWGHRQGAWECAVEGRKRG